MIERILAWLSTGNNIFWFTGGLLMVAALVVLTGYLP